MIATDSSRAAKKALRAVLSSMRRGRVLSYMVQRRFPAIRQLVIASSFVVVIGSAARIVYSRWRPEPPDPYQQAAQLDAWIHRDGRFPGVSAVCAYPSVIVVAFGNLSAGAKADLEHLVREHAPRPDTPVRYPIQSPGPVTSTIEK